MAWKRFVEFVCATEQHWAFWMQYPDVSRHKINDYCLFSSAVCHYDIAVATHAPACASQTLDILYQTETLFFLSWVNNLNQVQRCVSLKLLRQNTDHCPCISRQLFSMAFTGAQWHVPSGACPLGNTKHCTWVHFTDVESRSVPDKHKTMYKRLLNDKKRFQPFWQRLSTVLCLSG